MAIQGKDEGTLGAIEPSQQEMGLLDDRSGSDNTAANLARDRVQVSPFCLGSLRIPL